MGQVLHRSATTTEAVRRTIRHSQASMRPLARRHGINPKTVAKWKKRESTADRRTGPTIPRSTVLSLQREAIIVAFRKHALLPLDDCLYALPATIPQLTRSSLHRCLERHGISRLPDMEGDKPKRKKFDIYPIGFFHIDLAEVRTAEGKLYLFVAIDRTSKFAVVELVEKADTRAAAAFLEAHLKDFLKAYNFARRLKTLKGLTPYEYLCKLWTKTTDRFTLNPIHQMPALNS